MYVTTDLRRTQSRDKVGDGSGRPLRGRIIELTDWRGIRDGPRSGACTDGDASDGGDARTRVWGRNDGQLGGTK